MEADSTYLCKLYRFLVGDDNIVIEDVLVGVDQYRVIPRSRQVDDWCIERNALQHL